MFLEHASFIKKIFGIQAGTKISSDISLFTAFFLSGLVHWLQICRTDRWPVEYTIWRRGYRVFLFFFLQAFAIKIEDVILDAYDIYTKKLMRRSQDGSQAIHKSWRGWKVCGSVITLSWIWWGAQWVGEAYMDAGMQPYGAKKSITRTLLRQAGFSV